MVFLAGLLQFLYFVAHAFVVAGQEFAHRDDDVNLVGTFHQRHGSFGYLYFGKGLRGGESGRYTGNLNLLHFECVFYNLGKVGVDADGGHVFQVGKLFLKAVDALRETHHTLVAVRCLEGGQVDAVEKEFLYFRCVVLRYFSFDDGGCLCGNFGIVQTGVVLGQCGVVLALGRFIHLYVVAV